MKFIEIREGFTVKASEIVAIQRIDEDPEGMNSFVHVKDIGPQGSTFPYLTLLELIDNQNDEQTDILRNIEHTTRINAQRFSG